MSKYEKGETKEEYAQNRSKRIYLLLKMAGNISYDDYVMALKKTIRHGSTVILKRDIDEIYVNNYNSEWAEAWDANHDIQPALDYFAAITDYWAKPDEGITQILKEAAAILKSEQDQRKMCQQMANTFMKEEHEEKVKPCQHFLGGGCHLGEEDCWFSHSESSKDKAKITSLKCNFCEKSFDNRYEFMHHRKK